MSGKSGWRKFLHWRVLPGNQNSIHIAGMTVWLSLSTLGNVLRFFFFFVTVCAWLSSVLSVLHMSRLNLAQCAYSKEILLILQLLHFFPQMFSVLCSSLVEHRVLAEWRRMHTGYGLTWNGDHYPWPCSKAIFPGPAVMTATYSELNTLSVSSWFGICCLVDQWCSRCIWKLFKHCFWAYWKPVVSIGYLLSHNQSTCLPLVCNIKMREGSQRCCVLTAGYGNSNTSCCNRQL